MMTSSPPWSSGSRSTTSSRRGVRASIGLDGSPRDDHQHGWRAAREPLADLVVARWDMSHGNISRSAGARPAIDATPAPINSASGGVVAMK
jgi:hypothetical protein